MELLTQAQHEQLVAEGRASAVEEKDHFPVVRLLTPDAGATWLLSEIRADDPDIAFGLCDLGMGCPELGYVSLSELASARGRLGLPVERDLHFTPAKTLTAYARDAHAAGRITV